MREVVNRLREKGMSQRAACRHLGVDRTSMRYEPKGEARLNALIREELKRLARRHRRYGSPRMTALLRREGYGVNHKRVERLWREESLSLPRARRRRRRGGGLRDRPQPATRPGEVWSYDFIFDRTQGGRKLKILTVIDEFTRECLELRVEARIKSRDVLETLDELMTERGVPRYTRSDNGPEFIARELTDWLKEKGIEPIFIEPGSPWQNGFVESFHGKLRDECLEEEIFWTRAEAQVIVDWYREVYNEQRPHSSLGYQTPAEVAQRARVESKNYQSNW
jgi:transposase InsO family protein